MESSVDEWSKASILVSKSLASHHLDRRFEPRSLQKLHVRKFPVTCGSDGSTQSELLRGLPPPINLGKSFNNLKCVENDFNTHSIQTSVGLEPRSFG